jgi:hypothetical protein
MQNEVRLFLARRVEAVVEEQEIAIADGQRFTQETLRDDHVGVDVGRIERDGDGSQAGEGFHGFSFNSKSQMAINRR